MNNQFAQEVSQEQASSERSEFVFSSGSSLPVPSDQASRLIGGHAHASRNGSSGARPNQPVVTLHHGGRQGNEGHVTPFRNYRTYFAAISTVPRHPYYAEYSDRLRSYSRWTHRRPDSHSLAQAGFFFTNDGDLVRCYQCGIGLKDFCEEDHPLKEHVKHSGNCPYLLQCLGETQLADLKRQIQSEDPVYNRQIQWNARHTLDPVTAIYRHPEYQSLQSRLSSFTSWPQHMIQTQQLLADAGLYYTGFDDCVRCFACDGGLQRWDPEDYPWTEHCRWFPACPFARQQKGDEFIAVIHAATEFQESSAQTSDRGLSGAMDRMELRQPEFRFAMNENKETWVEMGYQLEDFFAAVQKLRDEGSIKPSIGEIIDANEVIKARRAQEARLHAIRNECFPGKGYEDHVLCYNDGKGKKDFCEEDKPLKDHVRHSGNCPPVEQCQLAKFYVLLKAVEKNQTLQRNFLLTNRGAHAYNGNGRKSKYNTRASKGWKKEKFSSGKIKKVSVQTAKLCLKNLKLQLQDNNTEGLHKNFRKSSATAVLMPASLVNRCAQVINNVGILEGGNCIGTIFRVGKRLGMTALHVVDGITNPHNVKGQDDLNQLNHCSVRFSEQSQIFRLKPVLRFKDHTLDVALVEFVDLCTLPPPLQLVKYDVSSTLKSAVIVGYGSPEQSGVCLEPGVDVLQQHDIPKNKIIEYIRKNQKTFRSVLKIMGSSADIVETGYAGCESATKMLLNCFLGPGASGSPVFTTQFPESLKVAGLFICGYPKMFYKFPKSMQKKFPLEYTFEAATKTSAIYQSLYGYNKKLAVEIFGR